MGGNELYDASLLLIVNNSERPKYNTISYTVAADGVVDDHLISGLIAGIEFICRVFSL
jgi:hypothetical protein